MVHTLDRSSSLTNQAKEASNDDRNQPDPRRLHLRLRRRRQRVRMRRMPLRRLRLYGLAGDGSPLGGAIREAG